MPAAGAPADGVCLLLFFSFFLSHCAFILPPSDNTCTESKCGTSRWISVLFSPRLLRFVAACKTKAHCGTYMYVLYSSFCRGNSTGKIDGHGLKANTAFNTESWKHLSCNHCLFVFNRAKCYNKLFASKTMLNYAYSILLLRWNAFATAADFLFSLFVCIESL